MPHPRLHLFWLFCLFFGPHCVLASLLIGAGSILPSRVILDAQVTYRFVQSSTQVVYYPSDSGAGKCRITNWTAECSPTDFRAPKYIDYAIGASMFTAADYAKYPDLQMYPTVVAALVPVFNLNGSQGLTLTRSTLAKIFCGQIRKWDDPEILATNPNFKYWGIPANQPIEVTVRRESADLTVAFKRAMAAFWANFTTYADTSSASTWGSALTTRKDGYESVNTYVLQTPWTISFTPYGYALDFNLSLAKMVQPSGATVECTLSSITYAVLEMGLSFGNNGDNPARLTADLSNAQGVNAWPINTYMYLILRKHTLRPGATCGTVAENVAFWKWFLEADVLEDIVKKRSFVQLPTIIRDVVLQRLITDVTCNGVRVYAEANTTDIAGAGETSLSTVFTSLARVYPLFQSNTSVTYNSVSLASAAAVQQALATNRFVVVRQSGLQPATGTATMLFAGVALVVISQYNLTLDGPTLLRILEGDIRTWLHPNITALNPYGMVDTGGAMITAANQTIKLYNGPTSSTATFRDAMQRLSPTFTGKALLAAQYYPTEELLRYVVAGTPYSLSVSVFYGDFSARLQFAKFQGAAGFVSSPSSDDIRACASADVYAAASNSFALSQSASPSCYPLSEAVYLIARKPQCGSSDAAAAAAAVDFVAWMFSDAGFPAALQDQHLAPLHDVSPAVLGANAEALESLYCVTTVTNSTTNVLPIVLGACLGGFFVVVVPVAWYMWSSTKEMRRLRKQFSDVKVAQECAEAIACFNLDAVAWLSTVPHPSKIQLAFLNIINLLVEVQPFIPDQLMAQLQAGPAPDADEEEAESPAARGDVCPPRRMMKLAQEEVITVATSVSECSFNSPPPRSPQPHSPPRSPQPHSPHLHSPTLPRGPGFHRANSRGHMSSAMSDASSVRPAGRPAHPKGPGAHLQTDSAFRTCTYLFAKFSVAAPSIDLRVATRMTAVAAHVVTLAKGHGATIDKVTYDSVAVHWNVSRAVSGGPLHATQLATELIKAGAILPPEAQAGFRLLVGVGHGLCHVATVSAAGQRFFVVGGPEVSTAVDVVMRELAVPVGCTILVSNAVEQEVQYAFNCFPRLWYHNTLLWEPIGVRKSASVQDEWMYEIQRLQSEEDVYCGRTLSEVFLMARNEATRPAVPETVQRIEAAHAAKMSPQDVACLNLLVRSLGAGPTAQR